MVRKILTAINIVFAWVIYLFSFVLPRSNNIWIFMGWHYSENGEIFADNSKYMFLFASQRLTQKRVVWVSQNDFLPTKLRNKGLRAYSIKSLLGVYYSLRAKYTFIDAFMKPNSWSLSGGSRIIQLWHGKGLKKTGYDSPYSLKRYNRLLFPHLFTKFHRLIASSDYTASLMASTFNVPAEKILITGLPRNDILFQERLGSEIDSQEDLGRQIEKIRGVVRKIILYAPTFRPNGTNPMDSLDMKVLNGFLSKRDFYMILSWHPKFARKTIARNSTLSNIGVIDSGYDLYPHLSKIDSLITDYSSLYIDFLLLNKPVIFYTFDLSSYKKDMGLHDDFEKMTPGPHPNNFKDLLKAIDEEDTYKKRRQSIIRKLFKHVDGKSSERITDKLLI